MFVNDEFKVSDKLTLTAGLRFDYQSARTEAADQYSTFSPTTPNPGAGGIPGAMIFAGDGPGRSGQRKFEDVPNDAWGPRLGFAYRIDDRQIVRGGYGIYYANVCVRWPGRSANAGIRIEPVRAEQHQRHLPRTSPGRGLSRGQSPVSAVHRSHNQYRWERHRRQP